MQITKREKKMLIAVGIILVTTGIYFLIYKPVLGEYQRLLESVAMFEINKSISKEIALIEGTIEDTLKALPEASDEPLLLKHLHHIFTPFGGLNSIHIEDPASRGEFSGVGVRLSYDLNYEEFHALLLALEGSPYRNRIDSFSLHRAQGEEGNEAQESTVDMSLTFYFFN